MSGFRLGRIFGIEVDVHSSWFVIAALLIWSLGTAALPADFPEVGLAGRYGMAAAVTVLFFLSLLAHELAHSLVARQRGIPVAGITFFIFGGMARASRDSRSPGEEFVIAIAGPVMSFLLAGLFIALYWVGAGSWPTAITGTLAYIGVLNIILGAFNLLPGFPMDGGRVLRAALWKITGSVDRATLWASRVGVWMALALMFYGFFDMFRGNFMGGLWLVLIATFIRHAARMSYRQHVAGRLQAAADEWAAEAARRFGGTGPVGPGPSGYGAGSDGGTPDPSGPPPGRDVTHITRGGA